MKKNKITQQELKLLHSNNYVERFNKNQKIIRIQRLISLIDFNTHDDVIDIGCGNGMLFPLIKNQVNSYTGIDFSIDFINLAKQKYINQSNNLVEFVCDDVNNFSLEANKKFTKALTLDLSEHVYDDEWLRILKSIHSLLDDNGDIYIHTPNSEFFVEWMKERNIILKQFPEHIAVRSAKENLKLISLAGFKEIDVTFLPHYNRLKYFDRLSKLPFVGKYFKARIFIRAKK